MANTLELSYTQVKHVHEVYRTLKKSSRHFYTDSKEPLDNESMCELALANGAALGCIGMLLERIGISPDGNMHPNCNCIQDDG